MIIFKYIYIIMFKCFYSLYHLYLKLTTPVDSKKAVFILSRTNIIEGNIKQVHTELNKMYPDIDCFFIKTKNKMTCEIFSELKQINNAKYIVLDDNYLPIFLIKPRNSQKVIQLWHAAGAFKKFGYSTLNTKFGPSKWYLQLVPIHSNYTHIYVSAKYAIRFFSEAFNINPNKIHAKGMPRIEVFNDVEYINKVSAMIKKKHPVLLDNNKIFLLIAPTYRAKGIQKESNLNIAKVILNNIMLIKENIHILFKPHPYIDESELKKINFMKNITLIKEYSLNDWMIVSDCFISDYSSAVFDFSVLEKPFAHFVPDLKMYSENRGLYNNIHEISDGAIIKDEKGLVTWINQRKKNESMKTERMVKLNFSSTQNVTKKIIKHFMEY